ncbi:MAG: acyltransferase, partial [Cyanobacteria bacterium HKST-UBA05]|nr:acyltransferase [Cyanobacteria bacterium HKST-UBA05]
LMPWLLAILHGGCQNHGRSRWGMVVVLAGLGLGSLVAAEWASSQFSVFSFYMLPTRLWELFAGTALAMWARHSGRPRYEGLRGVLMPIVGLGLIIVSFCWFNEQTRHPSLLTLIPVVGTMLVLWFARSDDPVGRLLSHKVVVGVGLVSYSLYMWHYPVLVYGRMMLGEPTVVQQAAMLVGMGLLAWGSYVVVEQPFRRHGVVGNRVFASVLLVGLGVLLVCNGVGAVTGYAFRVPEAINMPPPPVGLKNMVWYKPEGGGDRNKRVILIGDSHMISVANEIRREALHQGFEYAQYNKGGCLFVLGLERFNIKTGRLAMRCSTQVQKQRMAYLARQQPSYVVLGGRFPAVLEESKFDNQEGGHEGPMISVFQNTDKTLETRQQRRKALERQFRHTVNRILALGHSVVLVYPIPEVGWHVPQLIQKRIRGDRLHARKIMAAWPVSTDYAVFRQRVESSYALLDSIDHERVLRVYPERIFCNTYIKDRCATHDASQVFYFDDDHLSPAGAKRLADMLFKRIEADMQTSSDF